MHPVFARMFAAVAMAAAAISVRAEAPQVFHFGAINQRSVPLMAASWNPILAYVGRKAGVQLVLKIGKTAPETTAMTERGEHAFAFTNHMFTPERDRIGYKAILRLAGPPVSGVIVAREDSAIRSDRDLDGRVVGFPSREAFLGYHLPIDHLERNGITVKEVFAGNQEGAMAQLQVGQVAAAAVNQSLLEKYTQRQDFAYRVIWTSEPYLDIPIMVHPAVPAAVVDAVRQVFLGMTRDPEGVRALQASADAIRLKQPWSFVAVNDRDYDNYRRFYKRAKPK